LIYFENLIYRWELNYLILNLKFQERLILRLKLNNLKIKEIPTLTKLFKAANCVRTLKFGIMFGIPFKKHPRMTKILTDLCVLKDFPLRKDFPLLGFYENTL
jgi:NADH:ubiquinone oxidoreductase subunit C